MGGRCCCEWGDEGNDAVNVGENSPRSQICVGRVEQLEQLTVGHLEEHASDLARLGVVQMLEHGVDPLAQLAVPLVLAHALEVHSGDWGRRLWG